MRKVEPYWTIIAALVVAGIALYSYHLATGVTPDRVAFHVPLLDFGIYWYGIVIVGGIALGAYVVSRLARQHGLALFEQVVPANARRRPLTTLALPDDMAAILHKRNVHTLGDLLLQWGFDPRLLGLNRAGLAVLRLKLAAAEGVNPLWLGDAPWRQWNPDHVWSGVAWCLVLGVIGARLYHVFTPSPSMAAVGIESPLDYFRHPLQLINLRSGGLGIYGGIAGGALGLIWFTRRQRLRFLAWADLAVVGLALGQAVGRWGNFFNQELYGRPTDLPWAVIISPENRLPEVADVARFHPAFLYESLWNLLAFLTLYTLARRYRPRLRVGELTALYLILYGLGRILLETVRLDSRIVDLASLGISLPVASLVSAVIILVMLLWIIAGRRRAKRD